MDLASAAYGIDLGTKRNLSHWPKRTADISRSLEEADAVILMEMSCILDADDRLSCNRTGTDAPQPGKQNIAYPRKHARGYEEDHKALV